MSRSSTGTRLAIAVIDRGRDAVPGSDSAARHGLLVVSDQLVADGRPGPALDPVTGRTTEGLPFAVVPDQVLDMAAHRGQVTGRVEPAGVGGLDQVDRATAARGNHRSPAGEGF